MEKEIIGGLRNALERGESLDRAMQSFINAGYSSNEVRAAANIFRQGTASEIISAAEPNQISQNESKLPKLPDVNNKNKKSNKKLILLIILLVVLLAVAGGLIYFLLGFKTQ